MEGGPESQEPIPEVRFGVNQRDLAEVATLFRGIHTLTPHVDEQGDDLLYHQFHLLAGYVWHDIQHEIERDPEAMRAAVEWLMPSAEGSDRILAGAILRNIGITLAEREQIENPEAELRSWRRLMENEQSDEALVQHRDNFVILMEDLESMISDRYIVSAQPFLHATYAFAAEFGITGHSSD